MKIMKRYIQVIFTCWLSINSITEVYGKDPIGMSLVKWSFRTQTAILCDMAKENGAVAIDMVDPEKWDIVKEKGLTIAMADGIDMGIERGFCDRRWHSSLIESCKRFIPLLAEKGIKQVVCYSGINTDLSDEEALEACVEGLKPLLDIAEKANVTLVMELLSSRNTEEIFTKQRFSYYQCDNPEWGVALCKKLNSPNFKLLYDVWHMNDMGRDIMSDIKKYHSYISHYHIAGIPERKGLNRTDSFNYQQLMKLLKKVGYQGYVGLEPDRIEKNLKSTIQESITLLKNK